MSSNEETFTIGVEEEYQLVDPDTRELRSLTDRVLPAAEQLLGDSAQSELQRWQIEAVSSVCETLSDVRAQLVHMRRSIIVAAEQNGALVAAAGLHPFSRWEVQRFTPIDRYQQLVKDYQLLAREQLISGCHVHIGLSDRDMAIQVLNRSRVWLPSLLALAATSPFSLGNDTGYASYRTMMWSRWPFSGPPQPFASFAEYDAVVQALIDTGSVEDARKIYWDIRIPYKLPTIEFRVMDMCMTIDETVMMAGLVRALARTCYQQALDDQPYAAVRPEVLRAAHWRAARYGLDADLIDMQKCRAAPAQDVIMTLLEFVRPALQAAGEWNEISSLVQHTLARGNGATRQRAVYQQTGRLEAVVDFIIAETARGTEER